MSNILWPVTHVTRHSPDPWPAWPVIHDPVPDHGMSRSRLLMNHDEFTTIAFFSLQSGILDMAYTVYIVYTVSTRQLLQAEHGEQFFNYLWSFVNNTSDELYGHVYTFTPHLIMGRVLRYWPVTHVTHSHLLTHSVHDPWPADLCLLWWKADTKSYALYRIALFSSTFGDP